VANQVADFWVGMAEQGNQNPYPGQFAAFHAYDRECVGHNPHVHSSAQRRFSAAIPNEKTPLEAAEASISSDE
jgi:hypothetical protein